MVLCSCNIITSEQIKQIVYDLGYKPSVSAVLNELGCDNLCGTCMSNIVTEIKKNVQEIGEANV